MENRFLIEETVSVRYIVNDVASCVAFYTEVLDFNAIINPPKGGFAMLTRGNLRLMLNEPGAGGAGQAMPDGTKPSSGGWNRVQIQTKDIASAIDYLKTKDVKFRNEIVTGNGGKQILLLDPSGNLIELVEPKGN